MLVGESGPVIVLPVAVIAEHRNDVAGLSTSILAIFLRYVLRFLPFVGAPEEAVFGIGLGVGDCRPDAFLLLRWLGRLRQIGRDDLSAPQEGHAQDCQPSRFHGPQSLPGRLAHSPDILTWPPMRWKSPRMCCPSAAEGLRPCCHQARTLRPVRDDP